MILKDVMRVLDAIAPFEEAEEWDNVGLMVGDLQSEIKSILVALDPSLEVIDAAREKCINLILTHHPLIFKPISCLDLNDVIAKKIANLIKCQINLVSMHTNLDKATGGISDLLAARLGLNSVKSYGIMRVGSIDRETSLDIWLSTLSFKVARSIYVGRNVCRVAACPGSGIDYWQQALQLGCDTLVTGDVRYHAGLDAKEAGINVVDLGHFGTEEIIIKPLAERLTKDLKGIDVLAHEGRDVFSLYNN